MQKIRKYIALLLTLVFLFPIVIQPWHVLEHHAEYFSSNDAPNQHFCCAHEIHSESENIPHQLNQSVEHCPVCEYEFATFSLPQNNWSAKGELILSEKIFCAIVEAQNTFIGTNRLLRAPPTSI